MTATFTGWALVGGWGDDLDEQEVMVTLYTEEPLPADLAVHLALRAGSRWRAPAILQEMDSG